MYKESTVAHPHMNVLVLTQKKNMNVLVAKNANVAKKNANVAKNAGILCLLACLQLNQA